MPFKFIRHATIPALWMTLVHAGLAQQAPIDLPGAALHSSPVDDAPAADATFATPALILTELPPRDGAVPRALQRAQ